MKEQYKIFADNYLIDFNGKQSAIKAGYSERRAEVTASELLKKEEIQTYLAEQSQKTADILGITRERTMKEIGRLAFVDIRKFYSVDGSLKSIHDLDEESAAALAGVETYEEKIGDEEKLTIGQTKKIKTYDKTKALEMLAKHFKIYTDAPINNNSITVGYGKEE